MRGYATKGNHSARGTDGLDLLIVDEHEQGDGW